MPEFADNESKEINPQNQAEYWAGKGMPDTARFFAERAGLDHVAMDKLLMTAYVNERARLENGRDYYLGHTDPSMMGDRSNRPVYDAFDALARVHGDEGEQGVFLAASLVHAKKIIEISDRETVLKLQANASVREYLSQQLKKQEVPLPHIPPTR